MRICRRLGLLQRAVHCLQHPPGRRPALIDIFSLLSLVPCNRLMPRGLSRTASSRAGLRCLAIWRPMASGRTSETPSPRPMCSRLADSAASSTKRRPSSLRTTSLMRASTTPQRVQFLPMSTTTTSPPPPSPSQPPPYRPNLKAPSAPTPSVQAKLHKGVSQHVITALHASLDATKPATVHATSASSTPTSLPNRRRTVSAASARNTSPAKTPAASTNGRSMGFRTQGLAHDA